MAEVYIICYLPDGRMFSGTEEQLIKIMREEFSVDVSFPWDVIEDKTWDEVEALDIAASDA